MIQTVLGLDGYAAELLRFILAKTKVIRAAEIVTADNSNDVTIGDFGHRGTLRCILKSGRLHGEGGIFTI